MVLISIKPLTRAATDVVGRLRENRSLKDEMEHRIMKILIKRSAELHRI